MKKMGYYILVVLFMFLSSWTFKRNYPKRAMNNSIKIEIDHVFINMPNYNPKKLDSVPENITISFRIFNTIDKGWAFGSRLRLNYMDCYNITDPVWGSFYMIHGIDTIILGSRSSIKIFGNEIYCVNDTDIVQGSVLEEWQDTTTKLLFNKLKEHKKNYHEYITDYIRDSRFVYIPVPQDYEMSIQNIYIPNSIPQEIIYPDTLIEVDKSKLYPIIISDNYDYERDTTYQDVMYVDSDTAYWKQKFQVVIRNR